MYFSFFNSERAPNAISRYINETRRVYGVLEMRLAELREALFNSSPCTSTPVSSSNTEPQPLSPNESKFESRGEPGNDDIPVWLVGNRCTIADISFLTWANVVDRLGIDLDTEYPVRFCVFLIHWLITGSTKVGGCYDGTTSNSQNIKP